MKDIYIHFGAHKSASTTIQRTLRKSEDYLRERGFKYLESSTIHSKPLGLHFRSLAKTDSLNVCQYQQSLDDAKNYVNELMSSVDEEKVIISYEGFCGGSALDQYGGIYRHQERIAESVREIFSDYRPKIVFIIRRQDEFLESCYLQQIKEGRILDFSSFKNSINVEGLQWNPMLDNFSQIYKDDFSVIPFELLKLHGDTRFFLGVFFRALHIEGIELERLNVVEKANQSISKYAIELHKEVVSKVSDKYKSTLRSIFAQEFPSEKYGKAKFFDGFDRSMILSALRERNTEIFDAYISRASSECGFPLDIVKEYWFDGA